MSHPADFGVMPFYRRPWGESRGDEHDDWGTAVYYFWVHEGVLEQQIELYENGILLAYDRYHREDQYGQMTAEPLDQNEWASFEIDLPTYQREVDIKPLNRKG